MNQMIHGKHQPRPMVLILGCIIATAGSATFTGCRRKGQAPDKKALTGPYGTAAAALKRIGRTRDAEALEKVCEGSRAGSCECTRSASLLLLDRDLHAEAMAVLQRAPASCRIGNLNAEALARAGKLADAEKQAQQTLKKSPKDKHAMYALAHVRFVHGDVAGATRYARQAAQLGRSSPAHLLLGLMAFKVKNYPAAAAAFNIMLKIDPSDSAAVFNLALISHKQNRYRAAREGYLKALRLNPRLADARHNLVVLTHGAGALGEARHHFKKFASMVSKKDPRLRALAALLRKPPKRPAPRKPGVPSMKVQPTTRVQPPMKARPGPPRGPVGPRAPGK